MSDDTLRAALDERAEAFLAETFDNRWMLRPVEECRAMLAELLAASATDEPLDATALERAFVTVIDRRPRKVEVTYFYGNSIPVEVQREAFLRDVIREYAALAASATDEPPDHEHYWVDAPDDEEAWHCSICGLTEYPDQPPFGSDRDARPAVPEALDAALAASATDEGPDEIQARLIGAGFVVVKQDDWEHLNQIARPAVPEALDVERLAEAIWLVQHNTAADHYDHNVPPGSPHRAEVNEVGEQVAREYEALSQREGERAYERGEDHP